MNRKTYFIAIAAIVMIAVSCNPLKILINTQKPNGERIIFTTEQVLYSEGGYNLSMSMGCRIFNKDTVVAVALSIDAASGHGLFDAGDKFMLRLKDNKEIVLINMLDKKYEEHTETYVENRAYYYPTDICYAYSPWAGPVYFTPYDAYRFIPEVRQRKEGKSYALYLITEEQVMDIITKGVTKMRVEIESADIDITETERTSDLVKDLATCLVEGIKDEVRKTEF